MDLQSEGFLTEKEKLKVMAQWWKEVNITYTPTFFVNGHKLPSQYEIEDLKYV